MINPIDKDKVAENPGLLPYAHTIGSITVNPGDVGKLKSRALSAMHEQTNKQLQQIQKQAELLAMQANELRRRDCDCRAGRRGRCCQKLSVVGRSR